MAVFSTSFLMAGAEDLPAFPGAEGFGRYTTGGRGGAVYHVTSLEDTNTKGTLRWALNRNEKRTIVFDVSGTIHLTSAMDLKYGNVTIAGQTAPGDGICIADYPFTIKASNVIIRFMRFRLGNKNVDKHEGDGLGAMDQKNIIVDHCSVSWSVDECLSIYGNHNTTVQWCIVSQSMNNSGHSKGAHGYGGNWGGAGATYHHNLMAHHASRVPRLGPRASTQTDERLDLRNNVFYNWAGNGCYGGEGMKVNIVNNYYKPGPGTATRNSTIQRRIASVNIRTTEYCKRVENADGTVTGNDWLPMWHVWGKYYVDGNVNPNFSDVTGDNWTYGMYNQIDASGNDGTYDSYVKDSIRLSEPIPYYFVTTHTAEKAYEKVLQYAGASLSRDSHDALMVSDTRDAVATYTGKNGSKVPGIIDSQEDNKPADAPADWSAWPTLESKECPADADGDGMPDVWEQANGLNPNDASDRNTTN
ncbi:MAG: pectate lyase, partial [Bacteroidaceae bacterium]|nr:pectate lyase [Bacteroidaceae bacterium]